MTATTGRIPVRAHHARTPVVVVSARAELVRSGIGHALGATVLSLLAVAAVMVIGWSSAEDPVSSWRGAAGIGAAMWLLAHLLDLSIGQPVAQGGGGLLPATLSPLGPTVLLAALHIRSGRRLSKLADGWGAGWGTLVAALATGAATTAVAATGVATLVTGPAVSIHPAAAGIGAGCFCLVAMLIGVSSRVGGRLTDSLPAGLRDHVRRCAPAVLVAVTSWLLAGSVLISVGLIIRIATVVDAGASLAAGAFGGVWLLAGQIALLPNALIWGAGLLSGAQLEVMNHGIGLSGSDVAAMPPVPLFGIAPAPGVWPLWAWAGVLLVVAAGAMAGWQAFRRRQLRAASLVDRCADAVAIGAGTGALAALLSWAARGSLAGWGPVGCDPVTVGLAVAVEVAVGALAAGVTLHLLSPRGARR